MTVLPDPFATNPGDAMILKDRPINVWVQAMVHTPNLYLQWFDENGRRRSESTGTADAAIAEQLRRDREYELRHDTYRKPSGVTWDKFRQMYEDEVLPGLRERTREKAETVFDVFEKTMHPGKLEMIDARMMSRFHKAMRERLVRGGKVGLAPMTQRNYLVVLKAALAWAKRQGFIAAVPDFPRVRVVKKKPGPVPTDAFDKLLAIAPDAQWRAFLLCGWYAGLRLSEANELRRSTTDQWPWLDLDRNRIILPADFAKAGEDQWVPLHPTLRTALQGLPVNGDRLFDLRSLSQRSLGEPLSRSGISTVIHQLALKAGVPLSMHRLRKGFGCRVAQELGRGNVPILHRLMRHSSMQVTLDYYASVDDVLQESINRLT